MVQRTQSGTFMGGLMQGFQFGENVQRNRRQDERRDQQFEQQSELHDLRVEAKRHALDDDRSQRRLNESLRHLETAEELRRQGRPVPRELLDRAFEPLDLSPDDFVDPEFEQSLDTLERAAKSPSDVSDRDAIAASNRVFHRELQRGIGETVERDGKRVTITNKEIMDIAPSPRQTEDGREASPGMMMRLRVTGEDEDGNSVTWRAPLTRNRSAQDDRARGISVDALARNLIGKRSLMQAMRQDPAYRDAIRAGMVAAGGAQDDRADWRRLNDGTLYNRRTGEVRAGGELAQTNRDERWHEADDGSFYDRRSGRTMTRDEAGLPPLSDAQDQRDRKIRDLMSHGVERARAEDIVDGRERIIQHPVSGQTMTYNHRTQETRPLDFPGQHAQMLPERDEPGMLHEPLEVGFVPWLAEIGSRTGGQFSDRLNNEELERARTNLRMLREEFIEALAKSGRPPVVEQQRILESFPSLGPAESPERARASLQAVSDSLVRIRNDDLRYAQDATAPAKARGEARERARSIDRMLRRLDPSLFEQADGPSPGQQGVGGPEAVERMSSQELQQLDPADMTDHELEAAQRRWEALHGQR